jgi:hypothetical protein
MNYQPPKRRFESSGYVNPNTAYYVPLENVTNEDNEDMKTMVDHGRYFSIFAPRQSGKTTYFREFAKNLEANSNYIFILMSFENCEDYDLQKFYHLIQNNIYTQLIKRLEMIQCKHLQAAKKFISKHDLHDSYDFYRLFEALNTIIYHKKIVIFIDEFDGIPLHEIKNFLSTLRKLYQEYKAETEKALYSVGLVGIRNITQLVVGGVSPFNIADHVEIPSFTLKNIRDLFLQYTQETNQAFTEEAVQKVYDQTQGQPWLGNRLGSILTKKIRPETLDPITALDVEKAIELLMEEGNNHFNNLTEKVLLYHETFKKILNGHVRYNILDRALSFLRQYGVIKIVNKQAEIANPIYRQLFSQTIEISKYQSKKIFISYAHEDRDFVDQLIPFLNIVKIHNIDFWFDQKLRPGDDWSAEIQNAIETARMTICLVSNSYLGSDFVQTREFPAIQTRQKEGMILFPIIMKDCLWKVIPWFKNVQVFPEGETPIEEFNDKEKEKAFMEIVQHVLNIFEVNTST